MAYKPRFGSKKREDLFAREAFKAYLDGRGLLPICNLCDEPVSADEAWHESHCPSKPKAFGGRSVGVAHAQCNLDHGRKVVTPMVAKAKRVDEKNRGLKGPGLGRHPMRAGRRSRFTKTFNGGLQLRTTLAEKHAALKAKRAILPIETEAQP